MNGTILVLKGLTRRDTNARKAALADHKARGTIEALLLDELFVKTFLFTRSSTLRTLFLLTSWVPEWITLGHHFGTSLNSVNANIHHISVYAFRAS